MKKISIPEQILIKAKQKARQQNKTVNAWITELILKKTSKPTTTGNGETVG